MPAGMASKSPGQRANPVNPEWFAREALAGSRAVHDMPWGFFARHDDRYAADLTKKVFRLSVTPLAFYKKKLHDGGFFS
jgi:hypothetical protein